MKTLTAPSPLSDAIENAHVWIMSDMTNMLAAYALGVIALAWAAAWLARQI